MPPSSSGIAPTWTNRDKLGEFLNARGWMGLGIEVGVREGDFAERIIKQWNGGPLILVDAWRHLPDYYDCANVSDEQFARMTKRVSLRFSKYGERVRILRALSVDAAVFFPDECFDWLYLDANHGYEPCKLDLRAWWPKVRSGGLFAGHDFYHAIPNAELKPIHVDEPTEESLRVWGVKLAVEEFAAEIGREINLTTNYDPSWWWIK